MAGRTFYWRWLRTAFGGAFNTTSLVAFAIFAVAEVAKKFFTSTVPVVTNWYWSIPFWALAGVVGWRLLRAPFVIWTADQAKIAALEADAAHDPLAHQVEATPSLKNNSEDFDQLTCTATLRNASETPLQTADVLLIVVIDDAEVARAPCAESVIRPHGNALYTLELGHGHFDDSVEKVVSVELLAKWGKVGAKPSRALRRVVAGPYKRRNGRHVQWTGRVVADEESAI